MSATELAINHVPSIDTLPLGGFCIHHAVVTGEGFIFRNNRICWAHGFFHRHFLWNQLKQPWLYPDLGRRNIRRLSTPALVPFGPTYTNYGHGWLDMAPRLHVLAQHDSTWLRAQPIIVPNDFPAWIRQVWHDLYGITPDQYQEFDPKTEIVACPQIFAPTCIHRDDDFHPTAGHFYAAVTARYADYPLPAAGRSGRLFLTRRSMKVTRNPVNIAEVEREAEALGLELIAPEKYDWRAQIALFARAKVVAGVHGSAMKNLLFSPATTFQIIINQLNPNQVRIAALKSQRCLVVRSAGFDPLDFKQPHHIDLKIFRACVECALRSAG